MKKIVHILSVFLLSIIFCYQAVAKDTVLTAGEVNKVLANRTMTVTETKPDKKTGKKATFKAYFSELGGIRALHPDGSSENYSWAVTEQGALCVKNNMRWSGGLCGYIVSDNSTTYKLFRNNRGSTKAQMKDGRAVLSKKWTHFLTFSDIKDGENL